jgi:hypothetical protein
MYAAGWQPVTLATVSDGCRVERYGPAPDGQDVLFAVYNPGEQAVTARLAVPMQEFGIEQPEAVGLLAGANLAATAEGQVLQITVPLPPDRCEVLSLSR